MAYFPAPNFSQFSAENERDQAKQPSIGSKINK
jgi:hypothetical protein